MLHSKIVNKDYGDLPGNMNASGSVDDRQQNEPQLGTFQQQNTSDGNYTYNSIGHGNFVHTSVGNGNVNLHIGRVGRNVFISTNDIVMNDDDEMIISNGDRKVVYKTTRTTYQPFSDEELADKTTVKSFRGMHFMGCNNVTVTETTTSDVPSTSSTNDVSSQSESKLEQLDSIGRLTTHNGMNVIYANESSIHVAQNSIIIGQGLEIHNSVNCKVFGSNNKFYNAVNCKVFGSNNQFKNAVNCHVSGVNNIAHNPINSYFYGERSRFFGGINSKLLAVKYDINWHTGELRDSIRNTYPALLMDEIEKAGAFK